MIVLGVSGAAQGAAAVAVGGRICAVVTESLVRGNGHEGLPGAAIDAALDRAGVRPHQVVRAVIALPTAGGSGWTRVRAHLAAQRVAARLRARLGPQVRTDTRTLPPPSDEAPLPGAAGDAVRAVLGATGSAPVDIATDAGPVYPELELHRKLGVAGLPREKPDDLATAVAALIDAGTDVAWFAGGAECTPWPLGHRCVLLATGSQDAEITLLREMDAPHFEIAEGGPRARLGMLHPNVGPLRGTRVQLVEAAHPVHAVLDAATRARGTPAAIGARLWRAPGSTLRVCTPWDAAHAFREDPALKAAALGPYLLRR
jgi:predicted NodU family carbamoyl transferase